MQFTLSRAMLGIAGHPLLAVVVLTYASTWAVLVPIALESHSWFAFSVPAPAILAAAWGPAMAALVVTAAAGGRNPSEQGTRRAAHPNG